MNFWASNKVRFTLLPSLISLLCFAGLSNTSYAEGFAIEPRGLKLESADTQDALAHPIPLSAIKRVSNSLRIEKKTDIAGERSNYLYRVDEVVTLEYVANAYHTLLREQGDLVYECLQRSCGSSNDWAHKVFDERNLAGRDSNQQYFAGFLDDGLNQGWLSVYAIENARRVPYVYVSFIPAPPQDIIADIKRGVLILESTLSDDQAADVNAYLSDNTMAKLVLVSFAKKQGSSADALAALSDQGAARLKALLISQLDIDVSKLETRAMGLLGQKPLGFEGDSWAYLYLVD